MNDVAKGNILKANLEENVFTEKALERSKEAHGEEKCVAENVDQRLESRPEISRVLFHFMHNKRAAQY